MTMNIYYKQSDITASLSELMLSPWALECDSTRAMGIQEALHLIQDMINGEVPENMKIPAADVRPVVHGKWIDSKGNPAKWDDMNNCPINAYCSICGDWLTASDEYPAVGHYCPNCGAKMEGKE